MEALGADLGLDSVARGAGFEPAILGLSTRRDLGGMHRRRRLRDRLAVHNDTRREQPGQDERNMTRSVSGTHDLRVVRHHVGDESTA